MCKANDKVLFVKLEWQADRYLAHTQSAKQVFKRGDIEEALIAATATGDDRPQKQAQDYSSCESFTHGISQQRVKWFTIGFRQGTLESCNPFDAANL